MAPMSKSSAAFTRRHMLAAIAVTPAVAQITSPVPPQGTPAPAPPSAPPNEKLQKAYDDIRETSRHLSAIDVAMNIEPAFTFKP